MSLESEDMKLGDHQEGVFNRGSIEEVCMEHIVDPVHRCV
jgi:hypothetical protein